MSEQQGERWPRLWTVIRTWRNVEARNVPEAIGAAVAGENDGSYAIRVRNGMEPVIFEISPATAAAFDAIDEMLGLPADSRSTNANRAVQVFAEVLKAQRAGGGIMVPVEDGPPNEYEIVKVNW